MLHFALVVVIIVSMENKDINSQEPKLTSEMPSRGPLGNPIIVAIIVIVVAATAIGAYFFIFKQDNTPKTKEEVISSQAKDFEKRLKELPEDATQEERYSLYLRLARGDYLSGNYEEAKLWLDQFPEEDRNYQGVWYHYALIAQATGDNVTALQDVKKAVEVTPDNPQPWELYFELIKDLPRDQQEAIYKDALAKTENDPKIQSAYDSWKAQ